MSETIKFLLLGSGLLAFGVYSLVRGKKLSRDLSDQKRNPAPEFFGYTYSEEFYRAIYGHSGYLMVLAGLAFLLKTVMADHERLSIRSLGILLPACS